MKARKKTPFEEAEANITQFGWALYETLMVSKLLESIEDKEIHDGALGKYIVVEPQKAAAYLPRQEDKTG